MAKRIEEAFNDCFERLSLGESLDSCLRSYPEHAMELDFMLRTAYDVKRRVYPIQPRPEFKYWSRVNLQGVQEYGIRHPVLEKAGPFNFRRNLAISVAGLLVLVIASSGTAAASYEALPDQPLYGVKMAIEQAQLAIAVSDVDKAELYANLSEKRAHEIEVMAQQGKADYLISTSTRMDYQLEQAENYISKYQAANSAGTPETIEAPPAETSTTGTTGTADQPTLTPPAASTMLVKPPYIISDNKSGVVQSDTERPLPTSRAAANVSRAKTILNSSTTKSLATLNDALDKAPESARSAIIKSIERVKKANEWSQHNLSEDQDQDDKPDKFMPQPNTYPVKPLPDTNKSNRDGNKNFVPTDKPKYIPPKNTNLTNPDTETLTSPVTVPNTQIQAPAATVILKTPDTGSIQAPVQININGTVVPQGSREDSADSSTIKVFSK